MMKIRATTLLLTLFYCITCLGATAAPADTSQVMLASPDLLPPPPARRVFHFGEQHLAPIPPGDTDNLMSEMTELEEDQDNLASIQAARAKIGQAISLGHFLQRLDSLAWLEFPVVLADTISNVPIAIVFDDLRLYPDYAQLAVFIRMELPQRKIGAAAGSSAGNTAGGTSDYVELFFGTPNLRFSHDGGIIGDALVGLYSDTPIGLDNPSKFGLILRSWHQYGSGGHTQDLGTYVRIDCDGFVELGLEADVLFSRDWIVPVNAAAVPNTNPNQRVTGHIQTVVDDWQNILVEISLPDFAPTSFPDIAFNLSTAVFDFSDFRNSPNVVFPPGYAAQNLLPANPTLWRGVYIKNLAVTLPQQIRRKGCQTTPTDGGSTGMLLLDDQKMYAYGTDIELAATATRGLAPPGLLAQSLPRNFTPPPALPVTETAVEACRTTVGVEDLFIDGHGVSGFFYAENVLHLGDGSMSGWRYSISDLALELVASDVVGFGFGGEIGIPIARADENFGYGAFVNIPDRTFNFTVITGRDYHFPVFKMADVTIEEGSFLHVTAAPAQFRPVAVLYGFAAIKARLHSTADDSQLPPDSLSVQGPRIRFQGLRLATSGDKLSLLPGGYLRFEGEVKILGYNIPLADPTLTQVPGGGLKLSVDISLNLLNQADNGFAAQTYVDVLGALETNQGIDQWRSDGLVIGSILVDIKLPALEIYGYAHVFEGNPAYGKGFQGSLQVKVGEYVPPQDPAFTLELNALFGQANFKYWYVDGFVEWNTATAGLVVGPIEINGFGGGAYYHMKMASVNLAGGGDGTLGTMASGVRYVPYEPTSLGLKATVAFKSPGADFLDGVATLELRFAGVALQEFMFYGKVEIVPPNGIGGGDAVAKFSDGLRDRISDLPLAEEASRTKDEGEIDDPYDRILATLFLRMNFELGFEFQGTCRAYISAAQGVIVGQGGIDFLVSTPQNRWHLYVGGYTNGMIVAGDGLPLPPISVSLNLGEGITAGADAYFLTGNDIPGPPPLHPLAAAYFGISQQPPGNRNQLASHAAMGTGFAFGAAVYARIDVRIRDEGDYDRNCLRADVGAGFDVSLLKYATSTYCSLSGTSPHGHKGWRATGRIWAYINGRARYRGFGKNLSMGVLIDADLPQPTFLRIAVVFHLVIDWDIKIKIGDECGIPYN